MAQEPLILVVGGGIGGLTTALALAKKGFRVDLFEQAEELLEVGAGLQLSPNATRVFYELGIGDRIANISCEPEGKEVRLWNTGDAWKLFDLGEASRDRFGYPYFTIFRPDLQLTLADAVKSDANIRLHLDHKCETAEQIGDKVRLTFANGRTVEGDALIAADGVHSRIRAARFSPDNARFSGIIAWRGVIPMDKLPERMRQPVGLNWIGPGAHVINYPLRNGSLLNFGGYVERNDWQIESWSVQGSREECKADFEGWHDDIRVMIDAIDPLYKWAVMVREPMETYTEGRIALLGDACHPTVPFLAQGAGMAIEDAYVMARCVEKYGTDFQTAFQRYEMARKDRTKTIVNKSTEMTGRFHNKKLSNYEEAEKYVSEEWNVEKINQRYNWLFEYDVTTVEI